ncbi:MAG TPA: hypothetical protein VH165_12770 [Kofleriaceae bacterium]|nr:hypothetical protein [Kofleriaceae bacterium]
MSLTQIDPSDGYAYYQIIDPSSTSSVSILAHIVATETADNLFQSGMQAGVEYWQIGSKSPFQTAAYPTLLVSKVRCGTWEKAGAPPFNAADANFTAPVDVPWRTITSRADFHKPSAPIDNDHGGFSVNISCPIGGTWKGTMMFFRSVDRLLFETITPGTPREFTLNQHSFVQAAEVTLV